MKKYVALSLLLALATTSFCQQATQKPTLAPTDYLQKSKKQKKIGLILLAGGAGLITTAFIIPKGELVYGGIYCGPGAGILCNDKYKNDDIKAAFGLTGGLSMLGSIPLFIASGKNKKKAKSASAFINMEKAPILQQTGIRNQSFPAVGVRISL